MPGPRRRIRLASFQYGGGFWYFVTFCTARRAPVLASIRQGQVSLSNVGVLVERHWQSLPAHHPGLVLDHHVVMPDHVHGIFAIVYGFPTTLPILVGSWKAAVSREARLLGHWGSRPLWDRG